MYNNARYECPEYFGVFVDIVLVLVEITAWKSMYFTIVIFPFAVILWCNNSEHYKNDIGSILYHVLRGAFGYYSLSFLCEYVTSEFILQ